MSAAAVIVDESEAMVAAEAPALMRRQAAEVLAAHRARRERIAGDRREEVGQARLGLEGAPPSRSQRIASLVSARYAQTPSYRAFLETEAEEATSKARAAAEVAVRTAEAVATAQRRLMVELADLPASAADTSIRVAAAWAEEVVPQVTEGDVTGTAPFDQGIGRSKQLVRAGTHGTMAGLRVRLFEDTGRAGRGACAQPDERVEISCGMSLPPGFADAEETRALDEEISFRQAPTFELDAPSVAIPGNLLEFPRQLVAARKARPRYAEGPLREDGTDGHDGAQLRIFEVEADQITQATPVEASSPEWSSIWLEALAASVPEEEMPIPEAVARRIDVAPLERRVMAAIVDGCLVGTGFILFAAAFAYFAPVLPTAGIAALCSAGGLAGLFLMYEIMFFTMAEATPGMRYARIGLCTFGDENPTRAAMRMRVLAVVVAACPLGFGFVWACLDDDRLGWHDRLSRMYQRSY